MSNNIPKPPNLDPFTIALGVAEEFEHPSSPRQQYIRHLDRQAHDRGFIHTLYEIDATEAKIIHPQPSPKAEHRTAPSGETITVFGGMLQYAGFLPPQQSQSKNTASTAPGTEKLCLVLNNASIGHRILNPQYMVQVPILSIRSIRRFTGEAR